MPTTTKMDRSMVIAVFIKDDLIQAQIDNLLALDGIQHYNVIFYQDNVKNSPKYNSPLYVRKMEGVKTIIQNNLSRFHNASFFRAETNIRPFGMCKRAMDKAFTLSQYAIFLEDDVFLAKNALKWFNNFYDNKYLSWDTYKFVTGESIFFDTQSMEINLLPSRVAEIKDIVTFNNYQQYFIEVTHFLTSSIFATTRDIWNTEVRELRGSLNGECALNDVIAANSWKSIFPVVPFAKDIGMLHDHGWSVAWHTKAGVREIKNTYLLADEFVTPETFKLLDKGFEMSKLYFH